MSNSIDIFEGIAPIEEVQAFSISDLEPYLAKRKPFIVRGLVANWPLVTAGKVSGKGRPLSLSLHENIALA